MQPTSSFQRHMEHALAEAPRVAEDVLRATLEQLSGTDLQLAMASERRHLFSLMEALQRTRDPLAGAFADILTERISEAAREGRAALAPRRQALDLASMCLVDEQQAQEDIEASRTIALIEDRAEWELAELRACTATLRGDTRIRREASPVRPEVYARSLLLAVRQSSLDAADRLLLLRTSAPVMAERLRAHYAELTRHLIAQGVTPQAFRAVPSPAPSPRPMPPQSGGLQEVLGRVAALPGGLHTPGHELPAAPALGGTGVPPPTRGAAQQAGAGLAGTAEFTALAGLPSLAGVSTATAAAPHDGRAQEPGQPSAQQLMHLVARLLNEILADPRLLPPVSEVLAHLQRPILRVALREPGLLQQDEHPTWQLINRVASHCAGYEHADDERLAGFLRFLEQLFGRLEVTPTPDARLFRTALLEVNEFLDARAREALAHSRQAVQALQRAEHREQLRAALRQQVRQMQSALLSEPMRDFLFGPWVDAMVESIVRHGEEGGPTVQLLETVDDLLWSLQPLYRPADRDRLRQMLPGLLQRLETGMDLIGWPLARREALRSELMARHTEALRALAPASPGLRRGRHDHLSPDEMLARLREESTLLPLEDGGTDRGLLPTVPVGLFAETTGEAGRRAREAWMARLVPGTWYHLFLQGSWTNAQLMWRSDSSQLFMFAGQLPGQSHSLTRGALERLRDEGLIAVLEERPLVQRAVDSLIQDLDDSRPGA